MGYSVNQVSVKIRQERSGNRGCKINDMAAEADALIWRVVIMGGHHVLYGVLVPVCRKDHNLKT